MSDLKGKNKKELSDLLATKREALRKFKFNVAGSKTRNVKEGKNLRKEIARILTAINEA